MSLNWDEPAYHAAVLGVRWHRSEHYLRRRLEGLVYCPRKPINP